jgi:hypothetical protein
MDPKDLIKDWEQIKKKGYSISNLEIKFDPIKGMGVYAKKNFKKGEIIEYCHAMVYDYRSKYIGDSRVKEYAFHSPCDCQECKTHGWSVITPFGFGSIYNSSESEESKNTEYIVSLKSHLIIYFTCENVKKGQEFLIWCGKDFYNDWCKPRQEQFKKSNCLILS